MFIFLCLLQQEKILWKATEKLLELLLNFRQDSIEQSIFEINNIKEGMLHFSYDGAQSGYYKQKISCNISIDFLGYLFKELRNKEFIIATKQKDLEPYILSHFTVKGNAIKKAIGAIEKIPSNDTKNLVNLIIKALQEA